MSPAPELALLTQDRVVNDAGLGALVHVPVDAAADVVDVALEVVDVALEIVDDGDVESLEGSTTGLSART